ncbi:MAG: diguanylate cyclase [Mycobacteriales bacterium]
MRQLPLRAQIYITALLFTSAGLVLWSTHEPPRGLRQVTVTVALTLCATLTQLFEVRTPNNKAYVATLSFIGASALLLPPFGTVIVAGTPFLVERLVRPKRWYVQAFNAASHVTAALAAELTARAIVTHGHQGAYQVTGSPRWAAAAVASSFVLLVLNHATLIVALSWARDIKPRDTGLFGWEGLLTDTCLLALGVVVAVLWKTGPGFLLFALVPFALLQRALHFPALQKASRSDPKTGLANADYFREVGEIELKRATRLNGPLTVIVADLDLLRNINNAYGHLAGDDVLIAVAEVLSGELREYDTAARFGGEEFALLLPNTTLEEGFTIADRIRRRVAARRVTVPTSPNPLSVTLSLGVATFPQHGIELNELMHRADLAVYRAKVEGRDRVRLADAEEGVGTAPTHPDQGLMAPLARLVPSLSPAQPTAPSEPVSDPSAPNSAGGQPESGLEAPESGANGAGSNVRKRGLPTWPVTVPVLAAAGLAWWLMLGRSGVGAGALVTFPLLAAVAELLGDDIYGSASISVSAVPILAAVAAGSPAAAALAAVVAALTGAISVRRRLEQALFNMAVFVLCAGVASAVRTAFPVARHATPADLPALLLAMAPATIAYFIVDNGLVTTVVSLDERRHPWRVFREDLAWLVPHFLAFGMLATLLGVAWDSFGVPGLAIALLPLALARIVQAQYLARTRTQVHELRRLADDLEVSKAEVERSNAMLEQALTSVRERHLATATTLARAIDARDETTGSHIERVCALGVAVCTVVDPVLAQDPQVAFGFLLHDVGKIGVPDAVLLKPGALTPEERVIMNRHPELGATLLEEAGFAAVAREIALTHHERWDGSGYPRGLAGREIPLCSRLFSVCDAMDAMTNNRPYRKGMSLEQALEELQRGSGTQFDPMAVEALLALPVEQVAGLLRLTPGSLQGVLASAR